MPYPVTITIDQKDDGRFRASFSEPEPGPSGSIVGAGREGMTRSIEAADFPRLMDQLKDVLGSALIGDSSVVELAADADEDAADLADARVALEDVRKNGGTPWEQVEAEMGF